jgi:hypothetical protein
MPRNVWEIHMNMLPGYRGEVAKRASELAIDNLRLWEPVKKLVAYVPELYKNVAKFTQDNHFKFRMTLKARTFTKNGIPYSINKYERRFV